MKLGTHMLLEITSVDFYLNVVPSDGNPGGVAGVFTLWPIPAINGSIKFQVDEKPAAPTPILNISDLSVKTFISKWLQVWKDSTLWVVTEVRIGGGTILNNVISKPLVYFHTLICFSLWHFVTVLKSCNFSLIICSSISVDTVFLREISCQSLRKGWTWSAV